MSAIGDGDDRQHLLGMITHHELEALQTARESQKIGDWVRGRSVVTIHPDQSIRDTANTLVIKDVLQAPVVSRKQGTRLLGIVTLHDIARQQNAIEEAIEREP